MDKSVVASAGIVIGILVLAAAFHTGLRIGPRYKLENRRDRDPSGIHQRIYTNNEIDRTITTVPEGGGRITRIKGAKDKKTKRSKRT